MSIKSYAQIKRPLMNRLGKDTKILSKDHSQVKSYQMFTQCLNNKYNNKILLFHYLKAVISNNNSKTLMQIQSSNYHRNI